MDLITDDKDINSQDEELEFKKDMSFSVREANWLSFFIFGFSLIIFSVPFVLIYGISVYYEGLKEFLFNIKITIPVILIGIVIHELIHGLFILVLVKQGIKHVKFGFNSDYYVPYVHSKIPLKAFHYRIIAISPLICLGIVPVAISFFISSTFLLFFGIVFIFAASGDILILWKIRKVDKENIVADHPERAGCFVYENPF
jgi:hypothetical protein